MVKARGYFMIPTPGTIAVDDSGNPLNASRDTVFTLYVETKSKTVKWERAWKNGRSFALIPSQINKEEIVGTAKKDNGKIVIAPGNSNTLWRLELADDQKKEKLPQAAQQGILLKGRSGNKPFYIVIKSLTELASPEYQ
ncbi:hypothetical protein [Flavisolibacter ginsenosidimutans]|uniref:Uncharacterized protein n=1 Tax=Flavisolibacter ginsenosidimutans TaxID=661481 RepID=A0A5B8UGW9_9BACT|nr:hypothetical protein [Flavisolibacter ginsenosidimutans]QEC55349.1 hypothetical protein FSB75_05325 [Flavisolibacter ginsenosidimutans]